jgi:hypothetical protein
VGSTAVVQVCAVEVYCERVRDLLAADRTAGGDECELLTSDARTTIRHKRDRSALVECDVASVHTAMAVLTRALLSRAADATKCVFPAVAALHHQTKLQMPVQSGLYYLVEGWKAAPCREPLHEMI